MRRGDTSLLRRWSGIWPKLRNHHLLRSCICSAPSTTLRCAQDDRWGGTDDGCGVQDDGCGLKDDRCVNLHAYLAKIKSHSPVIPDATRQYFIAAALVRNLVGHSLFATRSSICSAPLTTLRCVQDDGCGGTDNGCGLKDDWFGKSSCMLGEDKIPLTRHSGCDAAILYCCGADPETCRPHRTCD